MTRLLFNKRLIGSVLSILALVIFSTSTGAQKIEDNTDWEPSTSVSVRLELKGAMGQTEPYTALFTVTIPDPANRPLVPDPANRPLVIAVERRINPGQYTRLYFPEDFHARPFPGRYAWKCTVGNKVVAEGQFEYSTVKKQGDQATSLR